MDFRRNERGNALLMAVIVVLIITVFGLGVIRFASREVSGSVAGRREAAVEACAEAARALLMSQWKLMGTHDVGVAPLKIILENVYPTVVAGGHYGQDPTSSTYWTGGSTPTWIQNVQVIPLNPLTVGSKYQSNDLTNRIADSVAPFRVVVHCVQGDPNSNPPASRELELEFGVEYGL
jgi:type II secretory pathway pseudopilin PulG